MKSKLLRLAAAATITIAGAVAASAHTVSYGFIAGANPGEVDFWFGSYHSNGGIVTNIPFESQLSLQGAGSTVYGPQIFNFDQRSTTLPTGLVTGTNYFYADTATAYENNPSNVVSWMGVTATGLNAGDYTFELQNTASTTVFWDLWDDSIGARFTLTSGDIGGGGTDPDPNPSPSQVPLPAGLPLLLAGLGVLGIAKRRSRDS